MSAPTVLDSMSLVEQIARRSDRQTVLVQGGQVTNVDDGVVTVVIGGLTQTGLLTLAPVDVGDNVLVLQVRTDTGNLLYVLGPMFALTPPILGTVSAIPADSFTVEVDTVIGTVDAWFLAGYSPVVTDVVILTWAGTQPVILGVQGMTGSPTPPGPKPPPPTPAPPPPAASGGTKTFPATSCATWRVGSGWRDDANGDVIQGTAPGFSGLNNGAWFYGGRVKSTLAGVMVTKAQIWLGRTQGGNYGNQTVHLYRITQDNRPGGNVTYTATTTTASIDVGDEGWYTLPKAFAQALVDSGGSVGIQAASGPYVRLFGLSKSGSAGALRITWSKD